MQRNYHNWIVDWWPLLALEANICCGLKNQWILRHLTASSSPTHLLKVVLFVAFDLDIVTCYNDVTNDIPIFLSSFFVEGIHIFPRLTTFFWLLLLLLLLLWWWCFRPLNNEITRVFFSQRHGKQSTVIPSPHQGPSRTTPQVASVNFTGGRFWCDFLRIFLWKTSKRKHSWHIHIHIYIYMYILYIYVDIYVIHNYFDGISHKSYTYMYINININIIHIHIHKWAVTSSPWLFAVCRGWKTIQLCLN